MESVDIDQSLLAMARRIRELGLTAPAIALIEMHKPLCGLLHASALLVQPALSLIFGAHSGKTLVTLSQSPDNLERLITILESKELSAHDGC